MIVPRWVIGYEYKTLRMSFHLLRLLGRWLGSTILIKLMYAKAHFNDIRAKQVPGKKTKGLSYIHQGAFVTYVELNEKSSSAVVVMVP